MCTLLFISVFATFGPVLHCKQLHPPEPSLVYPAFLEGRGLSGSRILKINEDITLNLKKSSSLADEFLVRSYVEGILKHTYLDGSYIEENLFHDKDAMASVTVSDEEGIQVEGMIGNKLRIMPALEQERSSDGRVAHWLHEIPDSYEGLHNDYGAKKAKKIYPELFLLVDTAFSEEFGNSEKMIKYLCRTLNAVNLRYLSVDNPKVKFTLMGIEILSKSSESFLAFTPGLPNMIDAEKSVYRMRAWFNKHKEDYGAYDMVYLVTGRDMFLMKGSHIDKSNMGMAFVAEACRESRVGLGEDRPNTFVGVRIMTHELAHLMGCPHDGDLAPPQLGGPGSTGCPFADGYLMSYYTHNMNQYEFSSCCKSEISLMARSQLGKCLHIKNAQPKLKQMDENLPGEGVSKTTQCKRAFPKLKETHHMKDRPIRNCVMLCFIPKRVYGRETHLPIPLTDGTICDKNGNVCVNGRCRKKQKQYLS